MGLKWFVNLWDTYWVLGLGFWHQSQGSTSFLCILIFGTQILGPGLRTCSSFFKGENLTMKKFNNENLTMKMATMKIWQWKFNNENGNNENLTMKILTMKIWQWKCNNENANNEKCQQWKCQQWKINNEMGNNENPTMKMVVAFKSPWKIMKNDTPHQYLNKLSDRALKD